MLLGIPVNITKSYCYNEEEEYCDSLQIQYRHLIGAWNPILEKV